jgi:hypothetical protein
MSQRRNELQKVVNRQDLHQPQRPLHLSPQFGHFFPQDGTERQEGGTSLNESSIFGAKDEELIVVAVLAAAIPANRSARVDPVIALRNE